MKHPEYGNVPHVFYLRRDKKYYVRFNRGNRFYRSPYYDTIEEAIKARNHMQYLVPKSLSHKYGRKKVTGKREVAWNYGRWLRGEEEDPPQTRL